MFSSNRLSVLRSCTVLAVASATVLLTTSCATGGVESTAVQTAQPAAKGISGSAYGGAIPIIGTTIQLWAVGTAGDKSASSPLLSPAVTTDNNGLFNITGDYHCPSASTLVYLTAVGGNTGFYGTNPDLTLMSLLGECGNLTSTTHVTINEITTIGAVFSLKDFMSSYSFVGSSPTDLAALTAAFTLDSQLVWDFNGTAGGPGIPAGYGVPTEEINYLANILVPCVNSAGGRANDLSPCGYLFAAKICSGCVDSATSDTVGAALDMAQNTTLPISVWDVLAPTQPAFLPAMVAGTSWNVALLPQAPTPQIKPASGTYSGAQTVSITDAPLTGSAPDLQIFYTLDGTTPSTSNGSTYSAPFTVSSTTTVKAIAYAFPQGYADSLPASSILTIQ